MNKLQELILELYGPCESAQYSDKEVIHEAVQTIECLLHALKCNKELIRSLKLTNINLKIRESELEVLEAIIRDSKDIE